MCCESHNLRFTGIGPREGLFWSLRPFFCEPRTAVQTFHELWMIPSPRTPGRVPHPALKQPCAQRQLLAGRLEHHQPYHFLHTVNGEWSLRAESQRETESHPILDGICVHVVRESRGRCERPFSIGSINFRKLIGFMGHCFEAPKNPVYTVQLKRGSRREREQAARALSSR